jgi:hypothetical protein
MGGNAFKGSSATVPILCGEVSATLEAFSKDVLRPAGVEEYQVVGSAGMKPVSGDIDIVVGPFDSSSPAARRSSKEALLQRLKERGAVAEVLGSNIAVSFPIAGRPDSRVQIDVILSSAPAFTAWLMAGVPNGVKGAYRNMMLSYVAKIRSRMWGKRISVSCPGGIEVTSEGRVVLPRTEDPEVILATLGIPCRPSEASTFEGLVTILTALPEVSSELQGYPEYIQPSIGGRHSSIEAQRSIDALQKALQRHK